MRGIARGDAVELLSGGLTQRADRQDVARLVFEIFGLAFFEIRDLRGDRVELGFQRVLVQRLQLRMGFEPAAVQLDQVFVGVVQRVELNVEFIEQIALGVVAKEFSVQKPVELLFAQAIDDVQAFLVQRRMLDRLHVGEALLHVLDDVAVATDVVDVLRKAAVFHLRQVVVDVIALQRLGCDFLVFHQPLEQGIDAVDVGLDDGVAVIAFQTLLGNQNGIRQDHHCSSC